MIVLHKVARTLGVVCVGTFVFSAALGAQDLAYMQPLAVPPGDVGTCIAQAGQPAATGEKAATRTHLVMKTRSPGGLREMSLLRDRSGSVRGYAELTSVSTGPLASSGNSIVATLRPDGSITGFWFHEDIQMSDGGFARLDSASLHPA